MIDHPDTRTLLMNSMMELMSVKPVDKISVREITENCRVSTRSFYNHFKDKHDLVNAIYMSEENDLFSLQPQPDIISKRSLVNLFAYVKKNRKFYDNACSYMGQNNLLTYIYEQGYVRVIEGIRVQDKVDDVDESLCFAAKMWLNGMKDMITLWLNGGCILSPERLTDLIFFASPECMLKYINEN